MFDVVSRDSLHTEELLLRQLKAGDQAAFTEIYNKYWNKLYFLAHKHLKSAALAEEIVQDVFLTLWNKRTELSIQSLSPYLAAMTRYAVYANLAKQKRNLETGMDTLTHDPATTGDELAIGNKLLLEFIEKLSGELPEKCRLVFIHNKIYDKSLSDVSKELNISPKTAETHLTKALKLIRTSLDGALSVLFFL